MVPELKINPVEKFSFFYARRMAAVCAFIFRPWAHHSLQEHLMVDAVWKLIF
jgi:hypothetical protein